VKYKIIKVRERGREREYGSLKCWNMYLGYTANEYKFRWADMVVGFIVRMLITQLDETPLHTGFWL
jgi:hypothetical protein